MTHANRDDYLTYHRRRNAIRARAVTLLIAENRERYKQLLEFARDDTPAVTTERREVLFRETAPARRTA